MWSLISHTPLSCALKRGDSVAGGRDAQLVPLWPVIPNRWSFAHFLTPYTSLFNSTLTEMNRLSSVVTLSQQPQHSFAHWVSCVPKWRGLTTRRVKKMRVSVCCVCSWGSLCDLWQSPEHRGQLLSLVCWVPGAGWKLGLQPNASQAVRLCLYCTMIYAGLHSGY